MSDNVSGNTYSFYKIWALTETATYFLLTLRLPKSFHQVFYYLRYFTKRQKKELK